MGWREEFGKLRSLMSQGELGQGGANALWAWLVGNTHAYPEQYLEQALPYIEQSMTRWSSPVVFTVTRCEELIRAVKIAPFARFRFLASHEHFAQVFGIKEARAVVVLDLSKCVKYGIEVKLHHLKLLGKSKYMTNVSELNLSRCSLPGEMLKMLMKAPFLDKLTSVNLSHNDLAHIPGFLPYTKNHLFDFLAGRMTSLTSLDLSSTEMVPWHDVKQCKFAQLRHLKLSGLSATVIEELCEWVGLKGLKHLDLSEMNLGVPEVKLLANTGYLSGLEVLKLSGNPFGDAGIKALVKTKYMLNLRSLEVEMCRLKTGSSKELANAPMVKNLNTLKVLQGNHFGREEAFELAQSMHLPEPLRMSWERMALA